MTLYDIRISARAERDLDRLPRKVATACVTFIFGPLSKNPYQVSKPLTAELAGLRSARRGNYRIIYSVDDDKRLINIAHIDHRRHAYRS